MIEQQIEAPVMQTTRAAAPEQASAGGTGNQGDYEGLRFPEGMKAGDKTLSEFQAFAQEHNLSREQAQKALDYAGPRIKAAVEGQHRLWHEQQKTWTTRARGIFGQNAEHALEVARSVYQLSDKNPLVTSQAQAAKLREVLNLTGAGNHPEVVRLFFRLGKYLETRQGPQGKFLGSMYPNMTAKEEDSKTMYPRMGK